MFGNVAAYFSSRASLFHTEESEIKREKETVGMRWNCRDLSTWAGIDWTKTQEQKSRGAYVVLWTCGEEQKPKTWVKDIKNWREDWNSADNTQNMNYFQGFPTFYACSLSTECHSLLLRAFQVRYFCPSFQQRPHFCWRRSSSQTHLPRTVPQSSCSPDFKASVLKELHSADSCSAKPADHTSTSPYATSTPSHPQRCSPRIRTRALFNVKITLLQPGPTRLNSTLSKPKSISSSLHQCTSIQHYLVQHRPKAPDQPMQAQEQYIMNALKQPPVSSLVQIREEESRHF